MQRIPLRGELSVSVPGVVDGWNELLTKHGTRTLAQALEPAIKYARDGYAVSEIIADQWKEVESDARARSERGEDVPDRRQGAGSRATSSGTPRWPRRSS